MSHFQWNKRSIFKKIEKKKEKNPANKKLERTNQGRPYGVTIKNGRHGAYFGMAGLCLLKAASVENTPG